jgi:hypothetical protein
MRTNGIRFKTRAVRRKCLEIDPLVVSWTLDSRTGNIVSHELTAKSHGISQRVLASEVKTRSGEI